MTRCNLNTLKLQLEIGNRCALSKNDIPFIENTILNRSSTLDNDLSPYLARYEFIATIYLTLIEISINSIFDTISSFIKSMLNYITKKFSVFLKVNKIDNKRLRKKVTEYFYAGSKCES
jgi:hypothetical protein